MSDLKTWRDLAIDKCEWRDLEVDTDYELAEVFLDYCDPIAHIEKLQKALEIANEAIEFYAEKGDVFEQYSDDFSEVEHAFLSVEVVGKRARQAKQQIKEILKQSANE